jgi:hypothetical protein
MMNAVGLRRGPEPAVTCIVDVTLSDPLSQPHVTDGLRVTSQFSSGLRVLRTTIMAPLKVHIKHAGKKHDVELDTAKPPVAFKESVYQLTGVPVDRMKVMVKGGVLKVCRDFWNYTETEI